MGTTQSLATLHFLHSIHYLLHNRKDLMIFTTGGVTSAALTCQLINKMLITNTFLVCHGNIPYILFKHAAQISHVLKNERESDSLRSTFTN